MSDMMSAINKPYDPARGVRLDNLPPFAQRMREAADLVWEQGYRQPFLRELGEGTCLLYTSDAADD